MPPRLSGNPTFAVLHLADFGLQALLRLDAEIANRPVALLEGPHRNAVITSFTASATGVRRGQTPPQALVGCPGLLFRTPNPAAESEARAALLAAAFSVSPTVEETAPGVCTLQVAGLDPPAREKFLSAAIARLQGLGLKATAGLGSTPLLALYAARWLVSGTDRIAPLPLEVAEPPADLLPILAGWGIRTLGQLTALPKGAVAHRLGPAGQALWERAAGEVTRPLNVAVPARTFAVGFDCEHEMETLEPVLFILRRVVDRLSLDLENAGLAAAELRLQLGLADETAHRHVIRLPEPVTAAEVLFRTLHSYLESLRTAAAVISVQLEVEPTRIAGRQQGLFDGALRDPHGFAETLDRAAAIVGSGRVGTPELEDMHRADAFHLKPPPRTLELKPPPFRHPLTGLPLRRFRPPVPAKVELHCGLRNADCGMGSDSNPQSALRTPQYIWTESIKGAVSAIAGPWRGSGEWWQRDRAWQREEWDAELEGGGLYRLLHTPAGWFIEGEYD